MSKEPAPELPPRNVVTAGSKLRQYTLKPERELDVIGLKVVETINDRFVAAVDYRNYRLLKKWPRYEDDVTHKLHKMAKNIAMQMKDRILSGKKPDIGNCLSAGI